MSNTLAGIGPDGRAQILAINVPADMKAELTKRYQDQGYTRLTWNKPIREEDTDDTEGAGTSSET